MNGKFDICRQQRDSCSFTAFDITLNVFICNFHKEYWKAFNNGGEFRVRSLLRRACGWVQKEDSRLKFIVKLSAKKTMDLLKNAQVAILFFAKSHPIMKLYCLRNH